MSLLESDLPNLGLVRTRVAAVVLVASRCQAGRGIRGCSCRGAAALLEAVGPELMPDPSNWGAPACGPGGACVCWGLTLFRGLKVRGRDKPSAAPTKKPQRHEVLRVLYDGDSIGGEEGARL